MIIHQLRNIESIVVPTDFEPASETAFNHALALAMILKAELSIVHVGRSDDPAPWHHYPGVRDTLARWGLLDAGAAPADLIRRTGINVRKIRASGRDAARKIVDYVNSHPTSLLVVGSEGRRGLASVTEPSVAAAISRNAHLPTLFLPASMPGFVRQDDGTLSLKHIVAPVDESPDPANTLRLVGEIAWVLGDAPVAVDLVHVGEKLPPSLVQPMDEPSCQWRSRLLSGDPATRIADAARDANLIVMTTAGRCGALDAFLGSTAERVLKLSPCPLLTVPATV